MEEKHNKPQTKPNCGKSSKEREMGRILVTTRDKKNVCVCVCEGETGNQNKDAKERGVRERARNGEDGNWRLETRRVFLFVWRRNRGPKQGRKTEGSARANVEVFSSNRRKREGNPDDLKLRIWRDYPKSFTVEPRDLDPVLSAGVGSFSTRPLHAFIRSFPPRASSP